MSLRSVLLGLTLLLLPGSAGALPQLDELSCRCAEGALNPGDYNACLALFTRRLVASGELTREQRSRILGQGRANGFLPEDCPTAERDAGWGVSASLAEPFATEAEAGEPAPSARLSVRLWNHTDADIHGALSGGAGCLLRWRILDAATGLTVWDDNPLCVPGLVAWQLPAGSELGGLESEVPLVAANAANGLADGEPLPPGVYRIEITWQVHGPQVEELLVTEGGFPSATIALRLLARD